MGGSQGAKSTPLPDKKDGYKTGTDGRSAGKQKTSSAVKISKLSGRKPPRASETRTKAQNRAYAKSLFAAIRKKYFAD